MEEQPDFTEREPSKPELVLAWRGLVISLSNNYLSEDKARQMLESWERNENGQQGTDTETEG